MGHDIRDAVVDFVHYWSELTELPVRRFLERVELSPGKFGRWQQRFGKLTSTTAWYRAIIKLKIGSGRLLSPFSYEYPLEGYRRLAFMMLDRNLVADSPSTVYRVLKATGLLQDRFSRPSRKGKGFVQPLEPHQHWHIDFSFINITGTFYYLCSVLDGC